MTGPRDGDLEETPGTTTGQKIGRLQGIRRHLQTLDSKGFDFLSLANIQGVDPVAESPHVIPETFISEEVGGSITVLDEEDDESLAQENTNQMLRNFLPGGYKQRWGNFDLWRGNWSHRSKYACADIDPMFEWESSQPLTEILGDVDDISYTELDFDPEDVEVYVPRTMYVERLNKQSVKYAWVNHKGIVWTGTPTGDWDRLSTDPTTNYLWFKHATGEFEGDLVPLEDSDLVTGYRFEDDHLFVRCYYASLLTLYPRDTTRVQSGIMRYRDESKDKTAFVASKERSQLLTLDLDREEIRERVSQVLEESPSLRRDIQFSYLRALVWKILFFEEEALDHEFQVAPLIEHLLGVDFWQRRETDDDLGVFSMSGPTIVNSVERLLPENSRTRLRLLGNETPESSDIVRIIRENMDPLARIFALCRNDDVLLDFAEDVLVHSAEHGLSGWANELTGSGTAFELWYDVNFQEADEEQAKIAVYDPIQGGAGISKEVFYQLQEQKETGADIKVNHGLAAQGRCHSGVADEVTVRLLGKYPDGSLYDVRKSDKNQFRSLITETIDDVVDDKSEFSVDDLRSNVSRRVRSLFETRRLAQFYSYIAGEYSTIEETVGRTPRPADIALHLDRHVFRDPEIQTTYERFASDTGRRDLAELSERIEELTVQCITACPDCLKTDRGNCVHGSGHQASRLNRRLLTEVF